MTDVVKSFGYQLDSLVDYIQANYRCESPESVFARYIFYLIDNQPPFRVACDGVMQSMESRMHEAPVLAAFGYELACGRVLDDTLQKSWAKGLNRLSKRDAFPPERASFFFQPIQLLGISLGASACQMVRSEDKRWLQDVLTRGEQKLANSEFWTFIVSWYAAQKLSVPWKSISLPLIENITVDELALVKWICTCDLNLATSLGLNQIETEIEKELLHRSLTASILPYDVSRAAVVHLALKTTAEKVFRHHWLRYSQPGRYPGETINFLQVICKELSRMNEQFESNFIGAETHDEHFTKELLELLPQLQSHLNNLQSSVNKAVEKKSKAHILNNHGLIFSGVNFVSNDNQNQNIEVQQNFNSAVYGVAGKVEGNQNIFVSEQKQTLAEAAQEIQQLLTQLEASNPTATEIQKVEFVKAAIAPSRKERFTSALNAGWKEAIKELLDNKFLNVAIAVLEGWKNAGG